MQLQEISAPATPPKQAVRHRKSKNVVLIGATLILLMGWMFSGIFYASFHGDESQYIYMTRFLSLFQHGQFESPEWHSFWAKATPPLPCYLMGISLKLAGYDLFTLNGPWDFSEDEKENIAVGNMPSPEMLALARLPSAVSAAAAVLLLYLIANRIAGRLAGLTAAVWLVVNPNARELMTRAVADGLLIFLLLFGLWLGIKLFEEREMSDDSRQNRILSVTLIILLGLVLGFGSATKLTGTLGIVALGTALVADALIRSNDRGRSGSSRRRRLMENLLAATGTLTCITAISLAVFVILTPAIHQDPIVGFVRLFHFRQSFMTHQMAMFPDEALPQVSQRLQFAIVRTLFTYNVSSALSPGWAGIKSAKAWLPLDALLVIVGISSALIQLFKYSSSKGAASHEPQSMAHGLHASRLALVYSAVCYLGIGLNMGMDWDRYTLPLWVFAALWAGIGTTSVYDVIDRRRRRMVAQTNAVTKLPN